MKNIQLLLVIAALLAIDVFGAPTISRRDDGDYEVTFWAQDTWIDQVDREANHHDAALLQVRNDRSRALLHFEEIRHAIYKVNTLNNLPGAPEVISASLRIRIANSSLVFNEPHVAVHRVNNFDVASATWDCSQHHEETGCEQWRMIGLLPQVVPSYQNTPSDVQTVAPNMKYGVLYFDLTSDVASALDETFQLSFLVKKQYENETGTVNFWSSESGDVKPDFAVDTELSATEPERLPGAYLGPELIVVVRPVDNQGETRKREIHQNTDIIA